MRDDEVAALFDRVAWGYDPVEENLTVLVATERWFARFPWDVPGESSAAVGPEGEDLRPSAERPGAGFPK